MSKKIDQIAKSGFSKRYQSGATMWSMLTIGMMLLLILYVAGKLMFVYIDYGIVKGSMQEIVNQQGFNELTNKQIRSLVEKRMMVDNIREIDKSAIKISKEKSGRKYIVIEYDKKVFLFGNVSALIEFNEEIKRERR